MGVCEREEESYARDRWCSFCIEVHRIPCEARGSKTSREQHVSLFSSRSAAPSASYSDPQRKKTHTRHRWRSKTKATAAHKKQA